MESRLSMVTNTERARSWNELSGTLLQATVVFAAINALAGGLISLLQPPETATGVVWFAIFMAMIACAALALLRMRPSDGNHEGNAQR